MGLRQWVIFGEAHKHTDTRHALTVLRARRERPRGRRAAKQRDELAALYPNHVNSQGLTLSGCALKRTLAALTILPSVWEGASLLWGRSMTEAEHERLSRNLAEVIDDLYRQHAPPRDHERLIQLVQVQIRHAMSLAERSAYHDRERPR